MYENITYAELKKLPKEQKVAAWKELVSLNPKKKDLALKLGVSPALVYNMIARYASDKPVGKKSSVERGKTNATKASRARRQMNQEEVVEVVPVNLNPAVVDTLENTTVSEESKEYKITEKEAFSITINKILSGEDARFFLNGIGNTLLKDQKYYIEVKITEK